MVYDNVLGAIGRTPLVRLGRVVPAGAAEVIAKLEYLSPGGSIKDRAALSMIEDAEARGVLAPGQVIVEASAGNTGVGLAVVSAVKGYRCVVVLPSNVSNDKRAVLAAFGAEIILARADVEPSDDEGYIGLAERVAKERGAFLPGQFENPANPAAHYATTGPEILEACDGRLDALVACVGSGGTLGGTARYLREHAPGVRIVGALPNALASRGPTARTLVEGIVCELESCEMARISDDIVTVGDKEAIEMTLRLAREEAILAGGSSGVAVCAAISVARELGPGKRVVAILADTGRNYLCTYFDEEWRREHEV